MIRKGQDYIKSIKAHTPEVYYEGEKVEDVTEHPAFRIPVKTVAKYYDMHWENNELRVYNPDVGEETSISFLRPKNKKDLAKIRDGLIKIYDYYRGFFGRSPDYLNIWNMVFYAHAEDFGKYFGSKYMENAIQIYREATKHDLFYTHAIVAPMYDRSRPPSQWEDPYIQVGVVEEKPEGVIVRGAAMISTAGPYAEMLWYLPNIRRDTDTRYVLYFSLPTYQKGVKFLARRGFQPREGGEFEYPISARFDESDAILIFKDVLVP